MNEDIRLAIIRQAFAQRLSFTLGIDPRVEAAFASVRREDFMGPGPWLTMLWPRRPSNEYIATPSADPAWLYMDCIFAILPERHLNNGQPSLHAKLIAEASIREGEHVVHIGTGTGYYTAIMAHLAGPAGKVTAIELDPGLAERARQNLAAWHNVSIVSGDGGGISFPQADVIYVNAGATRPAAAWLDGLKDGGRLILPLSTDKGFRNSNPPVSIERRGAVFRIERAADQFLARWISPVAIIPCEGARDPVSEAALAAALEKGGWKQVTRFYRCEDIPEDRCWLRAPGWSLAYS
jgi:protein-L-isoaspartate(D-aspartate) O-methyltransferase